MKKPADPEEAKLLNKFINGGRTNLTEWVESICKEFCEDEATETYSSLQSIESHFFFDLHDSFFCLLPVLLHKFLITKGVSHIVEPRPSLADWGSIGRSFISFDISHFCGNGLALAFISSLFLIRFSRSSFWIYGDSL